ncbi:hypothetical protein KSP39_PZI016358 [Platanthera zijinensis]|uniref:Btz domain-containing protein n=1 Tax=Platanthera zijinensis TaxID=2320716 RepID=A0AAP0B7H8_9ASPA
MRSEDELHGEEEEEDELLAEDMVAEVLYEDDTEIKERLSNELGYGANEDAVHGSVHLPEESSNRPAGVEKEENEPYAVPTAGALYMHDDRFQENGRGRQRGLELLSKQPSSLLVELVRLSFGATCGFSPSPFDKNPSPPTYLLPSPIFNPSPPPYPLRPDPTPPARQPFPPPPSRSSSPPDPLFLQPYPTTSPSLFSVQVQQPSQPPFPAALPDHQPSPLLRLDPATQPELPFPPGSANSPPSLNRTAACIS